jgi:hypothetical protein
VCRRVGVDVVVTLLADHKGLAAASFHHLDPARSLALSLALEVFEPSNVMHLGILCEPHSSQMLGLDLLCLALRADEAEQEVVCAHA